VRPSRRPAVSKTLIKNPEYQTMRVFIHEEQWAAARALAEGKPPTHARLAAMLGVGVPAVSQRARREGWSVLDFRRQGVRAVQAELIRFGREVAAVALEAARSERPASKRRRARSAESRDVEVGET
jgi:hypothetical protein